MMTEVRLPDWLTSRKSSMPLPSGIMMSHRTRSKSLLPSRSRASASELAGVTRCPSCSNKRVRKSSKLDSSSTIRRVKAQVQASAVSRMRARLNGRSTVTVVPSCGVLSTEKLSAVLLHDPGSRSPSPSRYRRRTMCLERLEHRSAFRIIHPSPGIFELNAIDIRSHAAAHFEPAAFGHRAQRVARQVPEDLHDLVAIGNQPDRHLIDLHVGRCGAR